MKSEVRSQKSEVRSQKSEVRSKHLTFSKFFVLLTLLLALVPLGVLAAPGWAGGSYIKYTWDETNQALLSDVISIPADATTVTSDTTVTM